MQPSRRGGDEADRAAKHQRRRCDFSARRPALVIAMGSEEMLQIVVGSREIGHFVTGEELGLVAPGHFEKVSERRTHPRSSCSSIHAAHQGCHPAPKKRDGGLRIVFDQVGHLPHPPVSLADRVPERCRRQEAAVDDAPYAPEARAEPPFLETRSRLPEIKLNRSWSLSPEASSGGRPSSVSALRTAAQ